VPVIVDFWGPLVRPVQTLGPMPRRRGARGPKALRQEVKINVDEASRIAGQLQISIDPDGLCLFKGQPCGRVQGPATMRSRVYRSRDSRASGGEAPRRRAFRKAVAAG